MHNISPFIIYLILHIEGFLELFYVFLCDVIIYCIVLYCIALYCTVLPCIIVHCHRI